jgi:hypothetical protein
MDADNEVLDGIRFVASMFIGGTIKICRECKNLIHEMSCYCWSEKSKLLGRDVPEKKNDHCCDATKYAIFTHLKGSLSNRSTMTKSDLSNLKNRMRNEGYL